jgi:hypothetical protein
VPIHQRFEFRPPRNPVLVMHLEGWVDAGLGGATAVAALLEATETVPVATFDGEELIDMRARRPVLHIENGRHRGLTWRDITLALGTDAADNDVLFLVGPEPDFRWRTFTAEVSELCVELGVRVAVGLGAFPAPAPHTRAVRLAATASDDELAGRIGFVPGSIQVPAGIQAALEQGLAGVGIPAVGLWARVPHYVAGLPYPAASIALLNGLSVVAGLSVDTSGLQAAADVAIQRVEALISNSSEHQEMVKQLEKQLDTTEGNPLQLGEIPSGDEIAAELERFLRGEG